MTLEEMERGFELHEKRMGRIEENLSVMQKNLVVVQDNLTVQGELLNRLDQRLDRLAAMFEEGQRQRAEDRETLRIMKAAMTSLFERMDAFIRGLERDDGHPRPKRD